MKLAKTLALATMTSSALLMAGCNSTGGYNYNNMSNTAKGATAGAVAGALIKSKGDSKDIAKGAAVGAVLGGGTGYVIDHTN
ncbi:glycine zipper 2TM domain-containing protein [Psychrobacter sp. YP14]|jgi:hypothetical protein|uniref:Glycine zipper 2TM domain-containing protein n=3 Tax=Psychrobacter TaxID=497 RepID=A0A844M0W7_9GAMM|nr:MULTISPECIES: YMGG-like glycine zipper-containing protein [Psychrobacter]AWT50011.1 glycine zipper 2TM domain-containing protein [Psychrobacter sp. YP14]MUG32586.1 glycine zipper 2TM domain-containing protein [Psychrobacter sanguinis]UNK05332.1 YMGG-like glycine zipper-containing protein [Psychrobacter sp. PraFG1]